MLREQPNNTIKNSRTWDRNVLRTGMIIWLNDLRCGTTHESTFAGINGLNLLYEKLQWLFLSNLPNGIDCYLLLKEHSWKFVLYTSWTMYNHLSAECKELRRDNANECRCFSHAEWSFPIYNIAAKIERFLPIPPWAAWGVSWAYLIRNSVRPVGIHS